MSTEKNPEVVGCDASIMKDVWEIRAREYDQKIQLEQERIEKSALLSINKDWQNRLAVKLGKGKRVARKIKSVENQTDNNNNVWKSKPPKVSPSHGLGSGLLGRPGGQGRGFSNATPNLKDKKGQNFKRLQLLMVITQSQPSAMVWGKSWKYNKSLPSPEEGAVAADWGKCWMFATQQPYSEPGKPWLNGSNRMDPNILRLWKKSEQRVVTAREFDFGLSTNEWQMSWRKSDMNDKKENTSCVNGDNVRKSGLFTLLVETQHSNEVLCSSEWSKSWRSSKPANQQNNVTITKCEQMNKPMVNKQEKGREMKWEECWRIVNNHGSNISKFNEIQKSHSPEWTDSWRAATVVFNNHNNSDPSRRQDHNNTYNDRGQLNESHLHKAILVSHEQKKRDLYMQLCNKFKAVSEWSKSWQVTKNNSKPCEEIEKVMKASLSRMEATLEKVNTKGYNSTSEKNDLRYEQLKCNTIHLPKREFTQNNHLKHLENVVPASEWRESWRTLKHRIRMERSRMRPDPQKPFRESEEGGGMKHTTSDWKGSWKSACWPLRQAPEMWQQGWPTMPQVRVDRAREVNDFAPVELRKNGPTAECSWVESWRFSTPQHGSERQQGRTQISCARPKVSSHQPNDPFTQRSVRHTSLLGSVSDWQEAWMLSETQFHHDKPSLTQWRESWKSSFNTEHTQEDGLDGSMEMQPQREKISLQRAKSKMSRSFDNQMFRKRYPEKEWNSSWRAGLLLTHQPTYSRSSVIPGKSISTNTLQQHFTSNGHGSKWGMSFRLANPMPNMEQPWVESPPNSCHYTVMWSRGKNTRNNIYANFINSPATTRLWGNSHRFLQGASVQIKNKPKSKEPSDHRVIITAKTRTSRHLYCNIEKEKQSDRKWAGCHLLGKTQPRPKRGLSSVKKLMVEDENKVKFLEEWAESWRFLLRPGTLKMQMAVKLLSGWDESWKFLLPPYQPMNDPKAR